MTAEGLQAVREQIQAEVDDAVQFGQYRVGAARIDAGGMVAVDFDIGIGGLEEEAPIADVQAVRLVARVLGMHAEAGENHRRWR